MIKKKRYITPYVDFSWIEEELMQESVTGKGSGQPSEGEGWAKESSSFVFDQEESSIESFEYNFDFEN